LATTKRHDGRRADALRPVTIEANPLKYPAGSVFIGAGDTRLLCTASVQEGVPDFLAGRGRGWVTAEYAMLPASTPARKRREISGLRPDSRGTEIRRLIGRSLRAAVDLKKLGEHTIWLDCDVLQADGGTRTLAITGAWTALALAAKKHRADGLFNRNPIVGRLAAVSVGVVEGRCILDLDYREDATADVDMNVVMTGDGRFIEIQGTAEGAPFDEEQLGRLLKLARRGCKALMRIQKAALRDG
jgi:ribonuclease PH